MMPAIAFVLTWYTPPAISMHLINRLTEKDLKMLANDRNAKEVLRLMAKKLMVKSKHG